MDYVNTIKQMSSNLRFIKDKLTEEELNYYELNTLMDITIGHLNEIAYRVQLKQSAKKSK